MATLKSIAWALGWLAFPVFIVICVAVSAMETKTEDAERKERFKRKVDRIGQ
jgi:hypothetical protein